MEEARVAPEGSPRTGPGATGTVAASIRIVPNGPFRVHGARVVRMRPVVDDEGSNVAWERGEVLADGSQEVELCRCGASATKPFCDGSESNVRFDGTERAAPGSGPERRDRFGEPPVVLTDDTSLCALARFCHMAGTDAWTLAEAGTPQAIEMLRGMVSRCPSGRLVLEVSAALASAEPVFEPEVGVVDDGPYWIRGGIPVEGGDGRAYEVRNRMTLCRCGQSDNKPFCDGTHRSIGFRDPSPRAAAVPRP